MAILTKIATVGGVALLALTSGVIPATASTNASVPDISRFVDSPGDIPTTFAPPPKAVKKALKLKAKVERGASSAFDFEGVRYSQISYVVSGSTTLMGSGVGVASASTWDALLENLRDLGAEEITLVKNTAYVYSDRTGIITYTAIAPTKNGYAAMGQCYYSKAVKTTAGRACANKMMRLVVARPV